MTKKTPDKDADPHSPDLPGHKPPPEEKTYPSGTAQHVNDPPGTGYNKPRPGYPTE